MFQDKYVFAQLSTFLDRNLFSYPVRKFGGDRYVKHFTCWSQLLTLMFGQLSNRESLRELIVALDAHQKKSYHLGFGKHVARSNLAKANQNRDYRIFDTWLNKRVPNVKQTFLSLAEMSMLLFYNYRSLLICLLMGKVSQEKGRYKSTHSIRYRNSNTGFLPCDYSIST